MFNLYRTVATHCNVKRCIYIPTLIHRWHSSVITDPLPSLTNETIVRSNLSGQFSPVSPSLQQHAEVPTQQHDFTGLPTRHSRKRLPTVITDMVELTELATEIIETDIGRLFTYNEYAINKKEATTRNAAWDIADVTVQKVESVMRGFAYLVPGTMWNRWLTNSKQQQQSSSTNDATSSPKAIDDIPPSDLLILQQQLVDRLIDEGHAYMTIRMTRMEDMYGKKGDSSLTKGNFDAQGNRITANDTKENNADSTNNNEEDDDADIKSKEDSYLYDFALPGPTTAMYDTMLDTIACMASTVPNRDETLTLAQHLHEVIMTRHTNDGGDTLNDNIFTRPTAVSFNALIRIVAELPYDKSVNINTETAPVEDVEYRDEAVATFINTLQLMEECGVVHRNSASFKYALDCVAKYMPPSRIRGNISTGLFQQARYVGLINDSVITSFINANIPSNDEWNDNYIRDVLQPGTWPVKWKRESRKRQFHPKEDTY
jgi:hypothetical protein